MNDESEDIHARMRAWLQAQREYEAAYQEGPVGDILAKDKDDDFLVPTAEVPRYFFNDGPESAANIKAYIRANGDIIGLENYGVYLLRQAGGITAEGNVDLSAVDCWEARYKGALSVLPGLQSKLNEIRRAKIAFDKAIVDRESALDYIRLSPAMLFVNHDPMTATEKLFELPGTTAAMHAILERLKGDEKAINGLRNIVVDYIQKKIGITNDRAQEYLAFLDAHEHALTVLFEETAMQKLRNIGADLRRLLSIPHVPSLEIRERLPPPTPKRGWRSLFGR